MKRTWISITFCLIALVSVMVFGSKPAQAVSTTVVIGEVQTRGSAGASDEFVEIYNLSASSVNVGNYRIQYRSCAGSTPATYFTFPAGAMLQAYGHYLIANNGYDGSTLRDGALSSVGMSDCGQLQLQDNTGAGVDTLVYTWSGGTVPTGGWVGIEGAYFGGNPHDNTTGTNQDTSIARQPNTLSATGGHKNGLDTDVNATDFLATAASSPENTGSPLAITLRVLSARNNMANLVLPTALAIASVFAVIALLRRSRAA